MYTLSKGKKHAKRYSQEFKENLIDFYHSGQSVTQLSKEYGVAPATIYKWIDLYSKSNESSVSKADFLALNRQLAKVKEVRLICELLCVPESSYYERINRRTSKTQLRRQHLALKIIQLFKANRGLYGATKIHHLLLDQGEK